MSYNKLAVGFLFAFSLLFFGKTELFCSEETPSAKFDAILLGMAELLSESDKQSAFELKIKCVAEYDVRRAHGWQKQNVQEWGSAVLQNELDVMRFNLLRSVVPQTVALQWYDRGEIQPGVMFKPEDAIRRTHIIENAEDFLKWRNALWAPIIRNSEAVNSGGGLGTTYRLPPPVIIFETDKQKVFIRITPFGFYFDFGESISFAQTTSRLFHSPALAMRLREHVEKHNLESEDFPAVRVDRLSGKHNIELLFWFYLEMNKKIEGTPACGCSEVLELGESH